MLAGKKTHTARGVPRSMHYLQGDGTHLYHIALLEVEVGLVWRQVMGVLLVYTRLLPCARFHLSIAGDVVSVAVSDEDSLNLGVIYLPEKLFWLSRRIYNHGLSGIGAGKYISVVVGGAHVRNFVDSHLVIVKQGHTTS